MLSMDDLLEEYKNLLARIDGWFERSVAAAGPGRIACSKGCSACCRGFFDISLLDAFLLQQGFQHLPENIRQVSLEKSRRRLEDLRVRWPGFAAPYILNGIPDEEWTEMPEDDETPCPLLGADGTCLVYAWRPMICRLHGLPNIDFSGESFSDVWCTKNFPGVDPLQRPELRWEFRKTFEEEIVIFRKFSARLLGSPLIELDTFIPTALLIDFARTDWKNFRI
ncbi:MAG: YkgJ family cysteine cluster protein [Syntrophotaleaceae bacterium]